MSLVAGAGRWLAQCAGCGAVFPKPCLRVTLRDGRAVVAFGIVGHRVNVDFRGRQRVFLGVGHRFANSAGWQYLSRWVSMENLGDRLRPDEHVHHVDTDIGNNEPENLEVLSVEFHGRLHASAVVVAMVRHPNGRFAYLDHSSEPIYPWPRRGPILGPSANRQR